METDEDDEVEVEWDEVEESEAEKLGDYNTKGFEASFSRIGRPNIKPKGRRGRKSNKLKLEMADMATCQTKLTTRKGASLPQGKKNCKYSEQPGIDRLQRGNVFQPLKCETAPTKHETICTKFCPSNNVIFSSRESNMKNAHTILLIDVESFRPMAELGCQIGFGGSELSPATKLEWIGSHNLLMSCSVSGGPFGYRSDVKFWDIKSQKIVWECQDSLSDCFADVTVNEQFGSIFKLGVRNGGLFMVDLRHLNNSNSWVALGDTILGVGGAQNRILEYGKQVFISRGGDIEAWCEVDLREKSKILRKNIMDNKQGSERITRMTAGGNKLFVARKGLQGVEVWDSLRSKAGSNNLV
ncbi:BTB/POZ domain-containing protein At5g41330-like [Cryptomeria japonica]|uniref:BTB/POZ domain-containing protein At5g41330-like n=1 Tax=Cryptomeria japonica TaxID=3369 RepID=UPI0027DAABD7|nr:BTB/POZ domain-containing protein At5g41330-like [Cryptomeria japonica]